MLTHGPVVGMTNTYAAPCVGLEPTWWLSAPATTVLPDTATETPSWSLPLGSASLAVRLAVWVWLPDQGPGNTNAAPCSCPPGA